MLAMYQIPSISFQFFFDDAVMSHVVSKTNLYANSRQAKVTRRSKMRKWTDLTKDELKKFWGVCLLMGQIKLPTLHHYFHKKGVYHVPSFSKIMSGRRFNAIMRNLHMEGDDENDPLQKVRPIITMLLANIQRNYYPNKKLCIDESMMSWKGRLRFRQYIQNKKHKFGIKFYELCEPNGFILNFMPHVGKSTVSDSDLDSGHSEKVVLKLMEPYLDKGHNLYMDNFYNSVSLSLKLHKRRTHTVGTLRTNRKQNPTQVTKSKLKVGQACWRRKGPVYVSKWKDKREVMMISTKHSHNMVNTENRRKQVKIKPQSVHDYNMNMGGVDNSDQLLSYYNFKGKPSGGTKKCFYTFSS